MPEKIIKLSKSEMDMKSDRSEIFPPRLDIASCPLYESYPLCKLYENRPKIIQDTKLIYERLTH